MLRILTGFICGSVVKNIPASAGDAGEVAGSIPGLERFPLRRKWRPTPVFLPGKAHGQWSLAGFSLWDYKELDTTEAIENPCTHEHLCYVIISLL